MAIGGEAVENLVCGLVPNERPGRGSSCRPSTPIAANRVKVTTTTTTKWAVPVRAPKSPGSIDKSFANCEQVGTEMFRRSRQVLRIRSVTQSPAGSRGARPVP